MFDRLDLQQIASKHLAMLLQTCAKRTPNPVPKIFKNLLNYLCNDQSRTPHIQLMNNLSQLPDKEYYEINRFYGILSDLLSVNSHQLTQQGSIDSSEHPNTPNASTTPKSNTKKRTNSLNTVDLPINLNSLNPTTTNEQTTKLQIEKRGAELTFRSICQVYNDQIESIIPELVQQPINQINQVLSVTNSTAITTNTQASESTSNELILINDLNLDQNLTRYQELINNICLIEYVCLCGQLNEQILVEKFVSQIPNIMKLIKSPLTSLRHVSSRCLAAITKQQLVKSMGLMLE